MGFRYLAAPYSGLSPSERILVVTKAAKLSLRLLEEDGEPVVCPIIQGHYGEIAANRNLPHDVWMHQSMGILAAAKELVVFKYMGWEVSKGVQMEIDFAKRIGLPILFLEG